MSNIALEWLTDDEILAALEKGGSNVQAARILDCSEQSVRRAKKARGLTEVDRELKRQRVAVVNSERSLGERPTVMIKGDEATIVSEASPHQIGDAESMMRARGFDPEEWIITNVTLNEWSAMTSDKATGDNRIVQMHQLKVSMRRKLSLQIISPARHVPPLRPKKIQRVGQTDAIKYVVIESDHQAPYNDKALDSAALAFIEWLQPDEHDFLGDTADFPTISKFMDLPAIKAAVQDCVNAGYDILRSRAEASPQSRRKKLKGNHDFRIESEQLLRSERMYGLAPAHEEMAALDIRRLLHLETLGIELVTDIRGWEHAEIEIVPGPLGLVAAHGWMTGTNVAERSMKARGRSQIVGHIHRRELTYWWDPSMEVERVGATVGCMCEVRGGGDGRYPPYVKQDKWLQGLAVVSCWPDDRFEIEHIRWDGHTLAWRNERFRP